MRLISVNPKSWANVIMRKNLDRYQSSERYFETASRSLWPWRESWLIAFVLLLALLDYVSTYAFLELSGNTLVYEAGALASWALQLGGFKGLFWIDIIAVSGLLLLAIAIRFLYSRFGFKGFGRIAFVVVLLPYAVITMAVIFNNIVLTFL